MAPAPWDSVPDHEAYFVLVTGANSGIGFGIAERVIDEYLSTRSLSSHIIVIPTTRSAKKSAETVLGLRRHAKEFAETSELLKSRAGPDYNPKDTTRRIHILSVQLDLCNLLTVRSAADKLINGTLTSPDGDTDYFTPLVDVKIPRLDSVIFNAGIGGFTGLAWSKIASDFLFNGFISATTWPTFKAATAGATVAPIPSQPSAQVGEVFCANVFGHYLFAHALLPLLTRSAATAHLPPARIIWESSVEGEWSSLSLSDIQGIKTQYAYESSKRLTDILCLTAALPASQPYVASYLNSSKSSEKSTPPRIYIVHPGVVQTTLFPLNAFMFFWYRVILYLARWFGSPWHNITAYNGAVAPVWVALQEQASLDAAHAERSKWGSATDRAGNPRVKKTEVEGWGWEGRVVSKEEEAELKGIARRMIGRKNNAVDLTEERRIEFEALGAECWKEMERLRVEWEARMNKGQ
ncbi:hypothetical protein QBC34DRAFT_482347 [Podospora aff. communis PSN243]|uniref:3-keto-steroid reductase n=1 Tax=Podospora aff. communis PSN243 TaxID=3040156 RepID=A0AAV9GY47_9PEZI|nr:hypothetical protein QBC34DRAFT_482347 [Podospora aff. communis PSN243]